MWLVITALIADFCNMTLLNEGGHGDTEEWTAEGGPVYEGGEKTSLNIASYIVLKAWCLKYAVVLGSDCNQFQIFYSFHDCRFGTAPIVTSS